MQLKKGESYKGFQLVEERSIKEIEGEGRWFRHEQSGIQVLALQNKDPHKVFSVNFMTLPKDNTGAAHIVEHTVCCASQKYPLKETFVALGQGSICTTMNACTYPDRTMYYVASAHEKDLMGIATVFLDMVFHPKIEENSQYFLQEGWHYVYDTEEDRLDVSGVVYHEMLGEYGEAGSYLQRYEQQTLFPNTCYQYDSGGMPEEIIKLTEEAFLAFYHTHYVGENATITLYGDFNLEEVLEQLDKECLKQVKKGDKVLPPCTQATFEETHYTKGYYPTALNNAPTIASLGFVVGDSIDCEKRLALELLEQMLLRSTASPLLSALVMEKQLGISLSDGGYDSCRKQPVFSIILKGIDEKQVDAFKQETFKVLEELANKGIDSALIDAAIESLEFELRETDASYEPIGIVYSEMMLSSYLYGGNPFNHICYQSSLEKIKKERHNGYFEKLIKAYFLDNTHRSLTVVVPSQTMQEEKEQMQAKKLEEIKQKLGKEGLEQIIDMNDALEEEQLRENEEELLKTLPQLTLEDMPRELITFDLKEIKIKDIPVLIHKESTKDIIYFNFLWDVKGMSQMMYHDIGLLAHVFSYIGTKKHTYSEIENRINTLTGGFHTAVHTYTAYEDQEILPTFKVSCKVIQENLEAFLELMMELFTQTQFAEKEKLRELIGHIVYESERSFTGAPEYRATQRVYTYLCEQAVYEDQVAGMAFYHYIKEIYTHFDIMYESLQARLMKAMYLVFDKAYLKMTITLPEGLEETVKQKMAVFLNNLPDREKRVEQEEHLECYQANEGFYNGQEGQAIAQGINFKQYGLSYKGQYEVVINILENTYLWDRVRLQGGAYGCDMVISREGYLVICSYCDPHLETTIHTYGNIGNYLGQLELEQETIDRAIVTTLGSMLTPMSMEQKSERACTYFVTGTPQEERQKIYDEIKQTTLADFREMRQIFEHLAKEGPICVLGNKSKLEQSKLPFKLIDLKI